MQPCPPPFAIAAATHTARALLPALQAGTPAASAWLEYSRAMRIAAVGKLLLTGRPRAFLTDLGKSAQAFAHGVSRRQVVVPTGRMQPFFDAVASGERAAASAIAAAAATTCDRNAEYEDDFLYLRFLMDLDGKGPNPALLQRYAALIEAPDPRLDCCLALQHADADAFTAALRALVDQEATACEALAAEDRLDPDEAITTTMVSVEGLALVQIAAARGLTVPTELPRVPSLGRRLDLRAPLHPDAWQEVEVLGIVA